MTVHGVFWGWLLSPQNRVRTGGDEAHGEVKCHTGREEVGEELRRRMRPPERHQEEDVDESQRQCGEVDAHHH